MANKRLERWYLSQLRTAPEDFPIGDLEESESPDFIVRSPERVVGIEVTAFHLPPEAGDRPHQGIASARRNKAERFCIVACITASIVLASSGYAQSEQTPRADSDPTSSDQRAAIAAFESYNQALVERDYAKLQERFLYVPFVVVDDASRVITSVDTVVAGLRMTRESLEAAGYATTKIESPRVSVLTKDRLLLNCRLRHLKKDGSLLAERANFYVMVKTAGIWKVGGIIPQDPVFVER